MGLSLSRHSSQRHATICEPSQLKPATSAPSIERSRDKRDKTLWDPGYHELEVSNGKKSSLKESKKHCKKHPEHKKFIPVETFKLQQLPEGHRDQLVLDCIVALISLTVRLVVCRVTPERPDNYPLSEYRGSENKSFGSGRVCEVHRKFTERDGESCPCTRCEKRPEKYRKKQWGMFEVMTAKHVVYNCEECRQTQMDIDYDKEARRDKCPKLHGVTVRYSNIHEDRCDMYVVSHDKKVCKMLESRISNYTDLRDELKSKHRRLTFDKDYIVCVSHPHGMSKHISVGEYKGHQEEWPRKWKYTTCTCPGSSGAPVFALSRVGGSVYPLYITHHSGCREPDGNESGRWGMYG